MDEKSHCHSVNNDFKPITLNELPQFSLWPSRLLGLSEWQPVSRNSEHILKEYNDHRWRRVFDELKDRPSTDYLETILHLTMFDTPKQRLFHIGETIYTTKSSPEFWRFIYSTIIDVLKIYVSQDDTIVELGCGWGRNLFYFLHYQICKAVIGGECTPLGIEVGNLVAKRFNLPATFFHFDFNNPDEEFLCKLEGTVVFTHNAIEQVNLISKESIVALVKSKPKAVIHFEPIYEYRNKQSLLHYLWKRYTEVNDYNRNLLTILKTLEREEKISIKLEKIHALGLHALNPGSFIAWKPVI